MSVEEQLEELRIEYFNRLKVLCDKYEQTAKEGVYVLDSGKPDIELWNWFIQEGERILQENGLKEWPSNFTLGGFI
jgi:hypothetical protein